MKYRIKDERLKKVLLALFDEKSLMKAIEKQMPNSLSSIFLIGGGEGLSEVKLSKEVLRLTEHGDGRLSIKVPKNHIEEAAFECEPPKWYPFPKVTPPKYKTYLVQLLYTHGERTLATATWQPLGYWTYPGDEHTFDLAYVDDDPDIVAFRELPPFYEPEE